AVCSAVALRRAVDSLERSRRTPFRIARNAAESTTRARRSITASASRYSRATSPSDSADSGGRPSPGTSAAPLLRLVERRLRDVDVPALDELRHLPIEKRQQQRADVRAVDVRVGHDDD